MQPRCAVRGHSQLDPNRQNAPTLGDTAPPDFDSLIDDVTSRIFAESPDDSWAYPGHSDDTTLESGRFHPDE
ncbi:hypothetical protein GCM10027184_45780 [Saccharothrix stipae]